jgi:hypothetical protein
MPFYADMSHDISHLSRLFPFEYLTPLHVASPREGNAVMTYESHLAFYESPPQVKVRVFPLADSLPMPKSGEFHREENQFTLTVKIIQRSK